MSLLCSSLWLTIQQPWSGKTLDSIHWNKHNFPGILTLHPSKTQVIGYKDYLKDN